MENKQYYITIKEEQIPVTEEVYRAYNRPIWAEHKRFVRGRRCVNSQGHRCMNDCSKCPHERKGRVLSLDKLSADGYDIPCSSDVEGAFMDAVLLKELITALGELAPDNRKILEMFSHGHSEREIAEALGMSQKGVNKRKARLFAQLRERLKDFR